MATLISSARTFLGVFDVATSLASLVERIRPVSTVVRPHAEIISSTFREVGVRFTTAFATFTTFIPVTTSTIFFESRIHATSDCWISSFTLDVTFSRPSSVGKTSRMPVADGVSFTSCLILVGTTARLTSTIQEFTSLFIGVGIINSKTNRSGEVEGTESNTTLTLFEIPSTSRITKTLSRSRINALDLFTREGGNVPSTRRIGRQSRRFALSFGVGASSETAVRIFIITESIPLPAADFTTETNRLVEGDTRIRFALVGEKAEVTGRIFSAVELVSSTSSAEASTIFPSASVLSQASRRITSQLTRRSVAHTKFTLVVGEHVTLDGVVDKFTVGASITSTNHFFRKTKAVELGATAVETFLLSCLIPLTVTIKTTNTFRKSFTRGSLEQVAGLPRSHDDGHGVEGLAELVESVVSQVVHSDTQDGINNRRIRELLELHDDFGVGLNSNTTDLNTTIAEVSSHGNIVVGEFRHGHHDENLLARGRRQHGINLGFDFVDDAVLFSRNMFDHISEISLDFITLSSHAAAHCSGAVTLTITNLDDTNTESSVGSIDSSSSVSVSKRSVVSPFAESFDHTSESHAFTTSSSEGVDRTINHEDDIHTAATSITFVETS